MSPQLPSDAHLQALHAQALQSLSPTTLARLRQGRTAAPRRRPALWLASAAAGLAALGLGLGLHLQTPPDPVVPAQVNVLEANDPLLDESPDLYLWLGDTNLALE